MLYEGDMIANENVRPELDNSVIDYVQRKGKWKSPINYSLTRTSRTPLDLGVSSPDAREYIAAVQ